MSYTKPPCSYEQQLDILNLLLHRRNVYFGFRLKSIDIAWDIEVGGGGAAKPL